MSDYGRRLILDYSFDRALWSVIDAFIREGFAVTATNVRRIVKRDAHRDLRRYVLLHATHSELAWEALRLDLAIGVLLPCQVAVYELPDGRTAVTVSDPVGSVASSAGWAREHPSLAAIARSLEERVARTLDVVARGRSGRALAA